MRQMQANARMQLGKLMSLKRWPRAIFDRDRNCSDCIHNADKAKSNLTLRLAGRQKAFTGALFRERGSDAASRNLWSFFGPFSNSGPSFAKGAFTSWPSIFGRTGIGRPNKKRARPSTRPPRFQRPSALTSNASRGDGRGA